MMGVPESFKALLADGLMGSSVHQEHDQKHSYISLMSHSYRKQPLGKVGQSKGHRGAG